MSNFDHGFVVSGAGEQRRIKPMSAVGLVKPETASLTVVALIFSAVTDELFLLTNRTRYCFFFASRAETAMERLSSPNDGTV